MFDYPTINRDYRSVITDDDDDDDDDDDLNDDATIWWASFGFLNFLLSRQQFKFYKMLSR